MKVFPFFQDIEDKMFLVIGGGKVAENKYNRLKMFTDNITVIAKKSCIKDSQIRDFTIRDILNADFVIAATDNSEINENIYNQCVENNIPVNVVDCPDKCTFIFPAIIKKGDIVIGISSSGKSPVIAQYLKQKINTVIPDNIEEITDTLYSLKLELKNTVSDQQERADILKNRLVELLCD